MIIKNKKLIFLISFIGSILIGGGILGFLLINVQKTLADIIGGPACFSHPDCNPDYWHPQGNGVCTYGWGPAECFDVGACSGCAAYLEGTFNVRRRCSNYICQVSINSGPWTNCGQCYDDYKPPEPLRPCVVESGDFNNALYIKAPNDNTQFAITDSGHLVTRGGINNVYYSYGDWIDDMFTQYPDNNLPIYNSENILVAFFHTANDNSNALYLRNSIYDFQGSLNPSGSGNFIVKNSADMIVAYIDNDGNLYLMGCIDDDGVY